MDEGSPLIEDDEVEKGTFSSRKKPRLADGVPDSDDGQKKVRSSSQFSDEENNLLVQLYIEHREEYHSKFSSASKNGASAQDRLAQEWAIELSGLSGIVRGAHQVKQRINDLKKRAADLLSKQKQSMHRTGGGEMPFFNAKPYIHKLADTISGNENVSGIKGAASADEEKETAVDVKYSQPLDFTPLSRKRIAKVPNDLDAKRGELLDLEIEYARKRLKLVEEQLITEKLQQEKLKQELSLM